MCKLNAKDQFITLQAVLLRMVGIHWSADLPQNVYEPLSDWASDFFPHVTAITPPSYAVTSYLSKFIESNYG